MFSFRGNFLVLDNQKFWGKKISANSSNFPNILEKLPYFFLMKNSGGEDNLQFTLSSPQFHYDF